MSDDEKVDRFFAIYEQEFGGHPCRGADNIDAATAIWATWLSNVPDGMIDEMVEKVAAEWGREKRQNRRTALPRIAIFRDIYREMWEKINSERRDNHREPVVRCGMCGGDGLMLFAASIETDKDTGKRKHVVGGKAGLPIYEIGIPCACTEGERYAKATDKFVDRNLQHEVRTWRSNLELDARRDQKSFMEKYAECQYAEKRRVTA